MSRAYRLIPMADNSSNNTNGAPVLPTLEALHQHFLEIQNTPREIDADDALKGSFAHAQSSRGWK